jgi:hypothetical protein
MLWIFQERRTGLETAKDETSARVSKVKVTLEDVAKLSWRFRRGGVETRC